MGADFSKATVSNEEVADQGPINLPIQGEEQWFVQGAHLLSSASKMPDGSRFVLVMLCGADREATGLYIPMSPEMARVFAASLERAACDVERKGASVQ